MTYDCDKLVLEGIPSFAAFARLVRPVFARTEIRVRTPLPGYSLVEVWDAATNTCLGNWEEEWFDFAGAKNSVVDKLDDHFRQHFKMKRRVRRRVLNSMGERPVGRDFRPYLLPGPPEYLGKPR